MRRRRGNPVRGAPARAGPTGTCKCPNCNYSVPKQPGIRCIDRKCPRCGFAMVRGS